MANKNQLVRLRALDRCLRNPYRKHRMADLIVACNEALYEYEGLEKGVSKRTVQNDIRDMRSGKFGYEAPIVCLEGVYGYEDPGFSIFNSPILEDDFLVLHNALDLLKGFNEFEQADTLKQLIDRLGNLLDIYPKEERQLIQFDRNPYPAGEKWLRTLYHHLKLQESLHLTYQPFSYEQPMQVRLFPLLLKAYNGRWFLIGYNHEHAYIQHLALDRLQALEVDFAAPIPDLDFDPATYFADRIGLSTPEGPVEPIIFITTDSLRHYLTTKPLHPSQVLLDEQENRFQLEVGINYELTARLLSYGPDLKVVSPNSYRQAIQAKLAAALEGYR